MWILSDEVEFENWNSLYKVYVRHQGKKTILGLEKADLVGSQSVPNYIDLAPIVMSKAEDCKSIW